MVVYYDEDNFSIKLYRDCVKGELVGLTEVIPIDELLEVWQKHKADTPQMDLVKESPSLVKDLVDAFCEDGTWLERQGVYTLTLAEAKQRAVDIIEAVSRKDTADTPQTDCDTCKHNKLEWYSDECDSCSKAHSNYEPQTDCGWK